MHKSHKKRTNPKPQRKVVIEGMSTQGWGVSGKGRDKVHVWGGVLGDEAWITEVKRERGRTEGAIKKIIHRDFTEVEPQCKHFDICGGCLWQTVPYAKQLQMKQEIVKASFARERLDTDVVLPVLASENPFFYRNKNDFTFGFGEKPALGFFESEIKKTRGKGRSKRGWIPPVFEVTSCGLQSEDADCILGAVRKGLEPLKLPYYHPGSRRGILRSLVLRQSVSTGALLLQFVAAKDCRETLIPLAEELIARNPNIKGVVLSINGKRSKNAIPEAEHVLAGEGCIQEMILGVRLRVSPNSFLQVNTRQAEVLYQQTLEFADLCDAHQVVDLYCGTGSLSLLLAQRAKSVLGIEVVVAAISDAEDNMLENKIENASFMCGEVETILPQYLSEGGQIDVATVNPPRAGVSRSVINALCTASPTRIVYVSCNPETLARDLVGFNRGGYKVTQVQPVDMFPQTPHVEVVVKLDKRAG